MLLLGGYYTGIWASFYTHNRMFLNVSETVMKFHIVPNQIFAQCICGSSRLQWRPEGRVRRCWPASEFAPAASATTAT